ncbi:MAG: antitoxin [Candidatus Dormibacteria bacterium]
MRTTLDLDASVLRQLRQRGRREHKSMGQVASELLARGLDSPLEGVGQPVPRWRARNLGHALVDLEDKEAVRVILDEVP